MGDYLDTGVVASQDGATPWATAPDVEPNTFYRVKVEYQSNALPVDVCIGTPLELEMPDEVLLQA